LVFGEKFALFVWMFVTVLKFLAVINKHVITYTSIEISLYIFMEIYVIMIYYWYVGFIVRLTLIIVTIFILFILFYLRINKIKKTRSIFNWKEGVKYGGNGTIERRKK